MWITILMLHLRRIEIQKLLRDLSALGRSVIGGQKRADWGPRIGSVLRDQHHYGAWELESETESIGGTAV